MAEKYSNAIPSTSSFVPALTVKEWTFKLILLGDTNVGKTSLLKRYAHDESPSDIYKATIGVDFRMKQMELDGEYVRALIWDTAGQERFRTMTQQYYRGSHGVILVYDVTNSDSFLHVQNWLRDFERTGDKNERVQKILVANKCDVPERDRSVSDVEGQLLSIELGVPFFETSAKTGANVPELFKRIATDLVLARKRRSTYTLTPSPSSCWNLNDKLNSPLEEQRKKKSGCCFGS